MEVRDFDIINEILSGLNDADYRLTQNAAETFFSTGDRSLLMEAAKKTGLSAQEILIMW